MLESIDQINKYAPELEFDDNYEATGMHIGIEMQL